MLKCIPKYEVNSILDIGCGEGQKTYLLLKYFNNAKVLGIDFTEEGIKLANNIYFNVENLTFEKENVFNIDKNKINYDIVSCFEVLEHVEDWPSLLKKISDISNKYVLVSVPTGKMRDYEKYVGHLRNFKRGEIEDFMNNNGFKTIKTFYAGFPFYSPLGRDWLNRNYDSMNGRLIRTQKIIQTLMYILFRFFCFNNIRDSFFGLFEKHDLTVNSK
nr:class I SAM-dependent methyltransferase [uncultured Brachyspira sp.]